jgi:hypothetical protein
MDANQLLIFDIDGLDIIRTECWSSLRIDGISQEDEIPINMFCQKEAPK